MDIVGAVTKLNLHFSCYGRQTGNALTDCVAECINISEISVIKLILSLYSCLYHFMKIKNQRWRYIPTKDLNGRRLLSLRLWHWDEKSKKHDNLDPTSKWCLLFLRFQWSWAFSSQGQIAKFDCFLIWLWRPNDKNSRHSEWRVTKYWLRTSFKKIVKYQKYLISNKWQMLANIQFRKLASLMGPVVS